MFQAKIEESTKVCGLAGGLSGCHSSVAEHWLHKPGVLSLIPEDCRPFHFLYFSPQILFY